MISPRKYNYSNLKEEDKKCVKENLRVIEKINDIGKSYTIKDPSLMEKMFCQTAAFIVHDITKSITEDVIRAMALMIDSYGESVEEVDTSDYFYGL